MRPSASAGQFAQYESFGSGQTDPKMKGENVMNDPNRVLIRRGARELTQAESDLVNGGLFITLSLCTNQPSPDGDKGHIGETGC